MAHEGHPIRVGLKLAPQFTTVEELRHVWKVADEAGFDHCWVFDHFAALGADPTGPILEAWTLVGAMAQATKRARIGVMVTGNTYRHPGVLAKMAVTADHLSGGRLEMGIGAGWAEREHTMLDLEYGTAGQRIDRLAEAIQVMKLLWTNEVSNFSGRYYRLTDALASPKPVQRPHPPIWIGGQGERKTLRVVAQHADVWNAPGGDVEECARLSAVLDRHCDEVGRDRAAVRRSVQFRFDGKVGEAVRLAQGYLDHGFTELVVILMGGTAVKNAEAAATQLLPRIKAPAGVAGSAGQAAG